MVEPRRHDGSPSHGYCDIYSEHGACSCSTGVPGNVCPLAGSLVSTSDDHERTCMHYRSFGDRPCDCGSKATS